VGFEGFEGFVGLGCFRGRFGCLMGASLGFRVVPCGFVLVFLFVGWLWLFLCILPVYLGAPYAFYKKILLIKKKMCRVNVGL
jgi:hypothetical protein